MSQHRTTYIRGYFIPKYNEDTQDFDYAINITNKIEVLKKYLGLLKEYFKLFFTNKIDNASDLKDFNDLYVLLTYGSLSLPWQDMVYSWLRKFKEKIDVKTFIENRFEVLSNLTRQFYEIFPADDRPGFNTSSLLIHSISTSALATCIYNHNQESTNLNSDNVQYIRTSSFFHNIGRPLSTENVINNSIDLLKQYFEDIFSEDILNTIIKTIQSINDENPSGIAKYIKMGKKLSSATEALKKHIKKKLSTKLNQSESDEINNNIDNKEFWEQNEEKIENLTKIYLTPDENKNSQDEISNISFQDDSESEIALIRGDARHIHEYTDHVKSLTEIRNSSKFLDYNLSVNLVNEIIGNEEYGVNPENIIYSSGGNIILFSPGSKAKKISDEIEEIFYKSMEEGMEMTADFIDFNINYEGSFGELYSKIAIKIAAKKNSLNKILTPVIFGSAELCHSCDKDIAVKRNPSKRAEDDKKHYCKSCAYKYILPSNNPDVKNLNVQKEWEIKIKKDYFDILKQWEWKEISPYIMDFISGVSLEEIYNRIYHTKEIEKKPSEYKLAVINSDGNLMGEFIAESHTLSDLYDRIINISNTMIKIFQVIEKKIEKLANIDENIKEDMIRLKLGKIYIGGDDILIIVPGYLSIPITLTLSKEFYKKMGKKTLSTGIFLCPPKFSIWTAIDTAKKLLNDSAKNKGRIEVDKNQIGAIDFQSYLTGIHLQTSDEIKNFTNKPLKIMIKSSEIDDIHYLLNNTVDVDHQIKLNLEENYDNIYKFVYSEKSNNYKKLKDLRSKAKRIQSFFSVSSIDFIKDKQKALAFCLYQTVRQREELGKESYLKIFNLLGNYNSNDPISLFDSFELIRLLSGGYL